jgi:hypothetical protein
MVLPLEYSDLMILVLAIFAFVGVMRGWYKEGITAFFAGAMALLVWKPGVAARFVDLANVILALVIKFVKAEFSLNPSKIGAQTVEQDLLLDPNSYRLYIVFTVVMLAASYLIGDSTFKGRVTALGRILGGVLGLANGYIIVALVRQYIMNYLASRNQFLAASNEVTMQLADVPTENFFAGYGIIFVFIVLIGVVALLIAGDRLKLPLK